MFKKIIAVGLGLLFFAIVLPVLILGWAHNSIREHRYPLPPVSDIVALTGSQNPPYRLRMINSASQDVPITQVVAAGNGINANTPYTMSHPAFVLEWRNGRMLMIDAGMTLETAQNFSRPLQWVGAGDLQYYESVGVQLGASIADLNAIVFTHLHVDHVDGIRELCPSDSPGLTAYMTKAQAKSPNYTTSSALGLIKRSRCISIEQLGGTGLRRLERHPGLGLLAAAGHTPGSQIIFAFVKNDHEGQLYAFVGDIVNTRAGLDHDRSKPLLYQTLIVPEDEKRLGQLRRYLRHLEDQHQLEIVISHDQLDLDNSGIEAWG